MSSSVTIAVDPSARCGAGHAVSILRRRRAAKGRRSRPAAPALFFRRHAGRTVRSRAVRLDRAVPGPRLSCRSDERGDAVARPIRVSVRLSVLPGSPDRRRSRYPAAGPSTRRPYRRVRVGGCPAGADKIECGPHPQGLNPNPDACPARPGFLPSPRISETVSTSHTGACPMSAECPSQPDRGPVRGARIRPPPHPASHRSAG